jgi:hypothetical protein
MPIEKQTLISAGAVESRVRRAVARDCGERLVKSRTAAERREFGDYYTVDPHCGNPQRWHLDLESLATEFGVLRAWEVQRPFDPGR